ncbi:hypothetical protein ACFPOA_15305 [Lysobacter niabensis]|uniref:hypothetical protein n=1 Tax=Agrilutibacter niabensis TaxID=380628 RepID=UPI003609A238
MTTVPAPSIRKAHWRPVLTGGLVLGTLDLLFACAFWGVLRDVAPARILQSIAAGVQGPAAFECGAGSAALGLLCHYFIATMMVLAYTIAGSRLRVLVAQPVRYGLLYGLLLYALMTWIVVPLSNAPQPTKVYLPWIVASIIMHAVLGVICAWSAQAAHRGR